MHLINKFIRLCHYIKNTQEIATISLPPLMPTNNDGETTNRKDYNDPI